MPRYRKTAARPEDAIQKAVFQHIRARGAPGLVAWHTPNGGKRKPIEAAIFKGLGVRAGVSDIIAVHAGRIFALELKAEGGRASEAQMEFIADIERAGAFACVAVGLDRAIATLEAWGLLRGSSTKATPAIQGATGRRPSTPTEPAEPPGAACAVFTGEGPEAAHEFVTVKAVQG